MRNGRINEIKRSAFALIAAGMLAAAIACGGGEDPAAVTETESAATTVATAVMQNEPEATQAPDAPKVETGSLVARQETAEAMQAGAATSDDKREPAEEDMDGGDKDQAGTEGAGDRAGDEEEETAGGDSADENEESPVAATPVVMAPAATAVAAATPSGENQDSGDADGGKGDSEDMREEDDEDEPAERDAPQGGSVSGDAGLQSALQSTDFDAWAASWGIRNIVIGEGERAEYPLAGESETVLCHSDVGSEERSAATHFRYLWNAEDRVCQRVDKAGTWETFSEGVAKIIDDDLIGATFALYDEVNIARGDGFIGVCDQQDIPIALEFNQRGVIPVRSWDELSRAYGRPANEPPKVAEARDAGVFLIMRGVEDIVNAYGGERIIEPMLSLRGQFPSGAECALLSEDLVDSEGYERLASLPCLLCQDAMTGQLP